MAKRDRKSAPRPHYRAGEMVLAPFGVSRHRAQVIEETQGRVRVNVYVGGDSASAPLMCSYAPAELSRY